MYIKEYLNKKTYKSVNNKGDTSYGGHSKSSKPHSEGVGETRQFFIIFQYSLP